MKFRRTGALAVAMLSFLTATASGAHALDKRTAESEVRGNGSSVAVAECRDNERVVSGGYRLDDGSSDTPTTSKAKGERAWTVTAQQTGFTAYALCSRRIRVTDVAETVGFRGTGSGRGTAASARCASDKRVIAGGFQFSEPIGNSPVFRSRPTDARTWSVLALSEADESKLKVLAYCVDDRGGISVRKDSAEIGANEVRTVEPKCRSSETRLSGGWTVNPRPDWNNDEGPDTFFSSAYPGAQETFVATAINFSSVAGTISGFAVCAD